MARIQIQRTYTPGDRIPPGVLGSRGDVARMAGVTVDAVPKWAERYPEFPEPATRTAGGDIYWMAEIEAWLIATGRLDKRPERAHSHSTATHTRS